MSDRAAAFRILLREDLASFIRKVFLTVSPAIQPATASRVRRSARLTSLVFAS